MNEVGLVLTSVGSTGVVVLVGNIVFNWLKKPKGNGDMMKYVRCPLDRSKTIQKIDWLKDVHDKTDGDGLPLWYIPRSMAKSMDKVAEATVDQNIILTDIKGLLVNNGTKLDTIIRNGKGG